MSPTLKRLVLILGCMFVMLSAGLQAQVTTGTLRGYVADDTGQALPGVSIEITSEALMSPRAGVTDEKVFIFGQTAAGGPVSL